MAHDIAYFRAIQNARSATNKRESSLWQLKRQLISSFDTTLDWETITVNGVESELQIINTVDMAVRKIFAKPGASLKLGSMILWKNTYWLLRELNIDDKLCYQGTIYQCNEVLRWQDSVGEIITAFGYAQDATKYGVGLDTKEHMQIAEASLKISIPLNEQTLLIDRDKRFILGQFGKGARPNTYVVSKKNHITNTFAYVGGEHVDTGFIELMLAEDQFREGKDNAELGVADYVAPSTEGASEEPTGAPAGVESGWF